MKLCRGISWCCGRALVLFTSYQGTAATLTISLQVVTLRKSWTKHNKTKTEVEIKVSKKLQLPPQKTTYFGTSLSNILISPTPPEVTFRNHGDRVTNIFLMIRWITADEADYVPFLTACVINGSGNKHILYASLESIFTVEPEKTHNFKRIFVFVCWGRGWFEMFYCCQMPKLLS